MNSTSEINSPGTATESAKTEDFLSRINPVVLLALGAILMFLSGMRWGVGTLAWFSYIPFLIYTQTTQGWRSRLWLFFTITIAVFAVVTSIITPPVSYGLVPLFAIPAVIVTFAILLIWDYLRSRLGASLGIYAFVSLIVINDWMTSRFSELGVWASIANTQLDNMALLQLVSITGFTGVSFLIVWFNALMAESILSRGAGPWLKHLSIFAILISLALTWGAIRVQSHQEGPVVNAAGISTEMIFDGKIPSKEKLSSIENDLFSRTLKAATHGAKLIVWNEGAALIDKANEKEFVERGKQLAIEHAVHLVMAYVVPLQDDMRKFENKYLWVNPQGKILEEYFKHHPVPGEGSIKGTDPLKVLDTSIGKVAGAICYDYDFPAMSREHSRLGAGLVAVPSSDWEGIDPQHTKMTRMRAIEGGLSVLRSVRGAASAGFDAYGRVRAWSDFYMDDDRIMMVTLPTRQVKTIYSRMGDVLPVLCGLFIFGLLTSVFWRARGKIHWISKPGQ